MRRSIHSNHHHNRTVRRLIRRGSAAALAAILSVSFVPASVVRAAEGTVEAQESTPAKEEKSEEPKPEPPKADPAPAEPASEPSTDAPSGGGTQTEEPSVEPTVSEEPTVVTTDGGDPSGGGSDPSAQPDPQGGDDSGQGDGTDPGTAGDTGSETGTAEDPAVPGDGSETDEMTGDGTEGATGLEEEQGGPDEENGDEEEGIEEALEHDGTNEELIASQRIIHMPVIPEDFRFYTCEGRKAVTGRAVPVYAAMDQTAAKVAELGAYSAVTELQSGSGWSYIEAQADSGPAAVVRGFVLTEELSYGEDAKALLKERSERAASWKLVGTSPSVPSSVKERIRKQNSGTVEALVPWYENAAFTWMRGTTFEHIVPERPALAVKDLEILEEPAAGARPAGSLGKEGLAQILEEADGWYYVESGDVRGFVKDTDLRAGGEAEKEIAERGLEAYAEADPALSWQENRATFYSLLSTKEGVRSNPVRRQIIDLAAKSLGCPYVWGGTDLYNGADCSGFVQTLFRQFGYNLPRVASAQSVYGTQIPVEDAMPGDLIFFAANGYVYHVALYIGDGKTIEAYSSGYGIIVHHIGNRRAVWATRIIED